ncbi:MAG: zinc-ribbon domain-containing protein, partial [Clostridia bacterium]
MFCTKCGAQMAEGQRFCSNCGAPAENFTPAAARPEPEQEPAPSFAEPNVPPIPP